jgi:pantetheine-phosphate adenylyltransferase
MPIEDISAASGWALQSLAASAAFSDGCSCATHAAGMAECSGRFLSAVAQGSVMERIDSECLTGSLRELVPMQHLREPLALARVAARWCERHRFWHGPEHVSGLLQQIRAQAAGEDWEILALAALYHDAIYDPRAQDNEEASAELLRADAADPNHPSVRGAVELIVASKWAGPVEAELEKAFFALDTFQLSDACPLGERLAYERAIFREYQWVDLATYRQKRAEFLQGWAGRFAQHAKGAGDCIELLSGIAPRVAVYPGSFNPFHEGHLSILRQAETMFDKVIVAVGINRQKPGAMQSTEDRLAKLQGTLPFHEVTSFSGLLTDFVAALPVPVTIVRGVRDGTDLEAELRYTRFLNELRPGTGVVWISCEAELQHLSSSAIRELEAISPGAGARYVPSAAEVYGLVAP